eukprot:m.108835 g.108835  ORF g.108835 m.108835 type:complete len:318 (+) comp13982_c0_seq3:5328-6281(+)
MRQCMRHCKHLIAPTFSEENTTTTNDKNNNNNNSDNNNNKNDMSSNNSNNNSSSSNNDNNSDNSENILDNNNTHTIFDNDNSNNNDNKNKTNDNKPNDNKSDNNQRFMPSVNKYGIYSLRDIITDIVNTAHISEPYILNDMSEFLEIAGVLDTTMLSIRDKFIFSSAPVSMDDDTSSALVHFAEMYARYGVVDLEETQFNILTKTELRSGEQLRDAEISYNIADTYLWLAQRYGSEVFPSSDIAQNITQTLVGLVGHAIEKQSSRAKKNKITNKNKQHSKSRNSKKTESSSKKLEMTGTKKRRRKKSKKKKKTTTTT